MADDGDDENAWFYTAQLDAFELYHIIQEETQRPSRAPLGPALPALGHATSGAIGSAIANLLVYPLDVVVTRVQVSSSSSSSQTSILDALRQIHEREGGLGALYSGLGDALVKSVLDSFLFFLAYNFARHARQSMLRLDRKRSLPVLEEIAVGMLAGAAAKLCTTPVQNVVTRKQTAAMRAARQRHEQSNGSNEGGESDDDKQKENKKTKAPSARAIATQIYRDKGWSGFWAGYSASLILTVNPALTFLLQGMLLRLLVPREKRKSPGARLTFLMAAASKAVASSITYPVSVAKTRAQAGADDDDDDDAGEAEGKGAKTTNKGDKHNHGRQTGRSRRPRATILAAIVAIARREGVAGLYRGLAGEVLKGFFTHGLTMLMKEHIHVAVIQLYYLILKALRRFPASPSGQLVGELASSVEERAGEVRELVGDAVESGKEVVERGTNQVGQALGEAVGYVGKGTGTGKKEKQLCRQSNVKCEQWDARFGVFWKLCRD